jgi:hypothetical protein
MESAAFGARPCAWESSMMWNVMGGIGLMLATTVGSPHDPQGQLTVRHASCRPITVPSAWPRLLVLAFVAQLATSCSVGMALHGEKQPNLSVLRVGAEKPQIEAELGPPESEAPLPDGRTRRTYLFETGNESSARRAAAHAALDVLTFGLWELTGTPLEIDAAQGREMQAVVTYDATGKAEGFDLMETYRGSAPPPTVPTRGGSRS